MWATGCAHRRAAGRGRSRGGGHVNRSVPVQGRLKRSAVVDVTITNGAEILDAQEFTHHHTHSMFETKYQAVLLPSYRMCKIFTLFAAALVMSRLRPHTVIAPPDQLEPRRSSRINSN